VLDPVWIMLGWGALLIGSGVHLGALERLPEAANGMQRTAKALGVLLLALGIIQLLGVAAGGRDYLRPLAEWRSSGGAATEEKASFRMITSAAELDRALADASAQRRAVLFDFYADWCVECKRMEKYTFTDPDVLASLDDFVTLKIDVTAQNDDDKALQKNFSIVGPPATLFFACEAGERESLRLVGFEHATPFAERLARARGC
jgi:thiol:disulfide interchange protein DsbD